MKMDKIFESDKYNLVVFRVTIGDTSMIIFNSKANLFKTINAYLTDNVVYLADTAFDLLTLILSNKHMEYSDIAEIYKFWKANPDIVEAMIAKCFK